MKPNKAFVKDVEAEDVDVHLYRSMIGSLMYLTASRTDITFAVCACARFQVTPKTSHLHAVKRIFRYLKKGFFGNVTSLFETMMVTAQEEVGEGSGLYTNSHNTPNDTQPSSFKPQKRIKPNRKQRQAAEVHSPSSEIPVEESILTPSNDPLLSGEDSIQLNELMIFYTSLQQQVLDLEEAKIAQQSRL
nr:hypothetical protein [Tanacetum cinerariifolium]